MAWYCRWIPTHLLYLQQKHHLLNQFGLPERFVGRSIWTCFLIIGGFLTSPMSSMYSCIICKEAQSSGSVSTKCCQSTRLTLDSICIMTRSITARNCAQNSTSSILTLLCRTSFTTLRQKYWSIFDDKGQSIPVKDHTCSIDTETARPICMKRSIMARGRYQL